MPHSCRPASWYGCILRRDEAAKHRKLSDQFRPPTLTVTRERLPSNSTFGILPSRDANYRPVLTFALPTRGHQANAPRLAMDVWSSGGELAATSLVEAALGPRRGATSLRTSRALVALRYAVDTALSS